MNRFQNKHIWIIGASSGIGKAIAIHLAREGATLALSARSEEDLNKTLTTLEEVAPNQPHLALPLDVLDHEALYSAGQTLTQTRPRIDSIIHLAAIYDPTSFKDMERESAHNLIDINLKGSINLILTALPLFRQQQGGQLAICGSVAGYCGLPNGQPYSASKAAIINLVESLCAEEPGLDIRLISPGFVRTPLTDKNPFPMPFIIEPEEAAERIANGLLGKAYEIHFPKRLTLMMKLLRLLPAPLYFALTRRLTG